MKFFPYVVKNVLRNKVRSMFTVLSIGLSLFLVAILYAYIVFQDELAAKSVQYNRLMTTHAQGLTSPLPYQHVEAIRALPGVRAAAEMSWFGGKYKDDKIPFAQFAVDPKQILKIYAELRLPSEQITRWQGNRTGCIVGRKIARNRNWKLGDKIPLNGDIYDCDLELTVDGIYDGPDTADLETLWFHYRYMDEVLKAKRNPAAGRIGIVAVKAESSGQLPELARRIEADFANSDAPVRAMTEEAFQNMFVEMAGNVQAFIRNTSLAVVFSLICVAGNTMAMSMRERTREVAVLKAIGFQRRTVLGLVLGEALMISLVGGLLGVGAAKLFFVIIDPSSLGLGMLQLGMFYVPWVVFGGGLALAAGIGLVSGALPAWKAAQASVVDGLRRVV